MTKRGSEVVTAATPDDSRTSPSKKKKMSSPTLTEFRRLVYAYTKKIPKGKVSTYKYIAAAIGHPSAYRAVGTSLCNNPYAPNVPCHRVVATDASMGGFCGKKAINSDAIQRKITMLTQEGVIIIKNKVEKSHIERMDKIQKPTSEELQDEMLAAPLALP